MDENHHQFPSLPENLPVLQASQPSGLVFQLPWTALKLPPAWRIHQCAQGRIELTTSRGKWLVDLVGWWVPSSNGGLGWLINPMGGGDWVKLCQSWSKKGGVVRWFDPKITHELIMWRTSILGIGALNGTCCTNFQTSWFLQHFPTGNVKILGEKPQVWRLKPIASSDAVWHANTSTFWRVIELVGEVIVNYQMSNLAALYG